VVLRNEPTLTITGFSYFTLSLMFPPLSYGISSRQPYPQTTARPRQFTYCVSVCRGYVSTTTFISHELSTHTPFFIHTSGRQRPFTVSFLSVHNVELSGEHQPYVRSGFTATVVSMTWGMS
jgi:hypothetical protein